ncbi:sensor histidine kinase [Lacinutrix jangbogonensis]|uniref:sensor histidine kinase n=1 Tax=Lacinutrix jangbogonensis TaxID=1469557 RepID=UPI0012E0891D|nr:sensor histidine kinase [Lacinutrix jangbogonensis]
MSKSLLYFILLFSIFSFSQSSRLNKKTYTKNDGLALDLIATLCLDNDGFLWLGGVNYNVRTIVLNKQKLTLQRFDGNTFHNIPLPLLEQPITKISQIYKRNDGKFYIKAVTSFEHILFLFDPVTAKFTRIKTSSYSSGATQLSKVFKYHFKDYILSQKEQEITVNIILKDLSLKPVFSFTNNENEFLIDSSTQFIYFKDYCIIGDDSFPIMMFDWKGNLLKTMGSNSFKTTNQSKYWITNLFKANKTFYCFINNSSQLHYINEKTKEILICSTTNKTLSKNFIETYNDDLKNHLIISSINNKLRFDTLDDAGLKTIYEEKEYSTVKGFIATSKNINEDLWVTYNNELHYYRFPKKQIKNHLNSHSIRAISALDSTNYIIATEESGWFKLNTSKNTIKPLALKNKDNAFTPISTRNIFKENNIIWSNSEASILRVDTNTFETETYNQKPVNCLERPNDSTIIYGTTNYKLMQFNTKTRTHKPLLKTDSLDIIDIAILKNSNLVVAVTDKGLLTYNLKTKAHHFYNSKSKLEDSYILMCDYHKDYGYLLGTRSGKIVAFNADNESFTTLYQDDLNAGIASILFNNDIWWINTFNGVVSFNPKDKITTRFSENEGLSNNEANRYSALKTKDKAFLVGTIKGLNYFRPEDLNIKKDSAELVLLKVNKYDKALKKYTTNFNRLDLESNKPIILPSENRALELIFALKKANKVTGNYYYRYRLNKKEWIELKHQNVIQIPNLAAGDHNLEIEALDFSRKKIANTLNLTIESKEFFYKNWWFISLISIVIISTLLWLLKQAQIKKTLQENFSQGLIQSQENERSRIAIELHDSISQQLTLIKRKAQSIDQEEITTLTHNTLEEVRALSRGLYPPLLKQLGLTESIDQLILDIDKQTNLFVSSEINKIDTYFNEEQALNCYRFIQECINNILKHADAKALYVNIIKEHNFITITIEDNGKGFDLTNAKIKNSLGLKTIYERIRILKGELTIDSKLKKGTKITAQIPL